MDKPYRLEGAYVVGPNLKMWVEHLAELTGVDDELRAEEFVRLLNAAHQHGRKAGAVECRETMAAFVEGAVDAITATSIRANWSGRWGDDPGARP